MMAAHNSNYLWVLAADFTIVSPSQQPARGPYQVTAKLLLGINSTDPWKGESITAYLDPCARDPNHGHCPSQIPPLMCEAALNGNESAQARESQPAATLHCIQWTVVCTINTSSPSGPHDYRDLHSALCYRSPLTSSRFPGNPAYKQLIPKDIQGILTWLVNCGQ